MPWPRRTSAAELEYLDYDYATGTSRNLGPTLEYLEIAKLDYPDSELLCLSSLYIPFEVETPDGFCELGWDVAQLADFYSAALEERQRLAHVLERSMNANGLFDSEASAALFLAVRGTLDLESIAIDPFLDLVAMGILGAPTVPPL